MLFLGKEKLSIDVNQNITIKKWKLTGSDVIFRDMHGNVTNILSFESVIDTFDVVASIEFNKSHILNLPKQEKK
jgi:hypothetical protein